MINARLSIVVLAFVATIGSNTAGQVTVVGVTANGNSSAHGSTPNGYMTLLSYSGPFGYTASGSLAGGYSNSTDYTVAYFDHAMLTGSASVHAGDFSGSAAASGSGGQMFSEFPAHMSGNANGSGHGTTDYLFESAYNFDLSWSVYALANFQSSAQSDTVQAQASFLFVGAGVSAGTTEFVNAGNASGTWDGIGYSSSAYHSSSGTLAGVIEPGYYSVVTIAGASYNPFGAIQGEPGSRGTGAANSSFNMSIGAAASGSKWIGTSGNWGSSENWTTGLPNGTGSVARFLEAPFAREVGIDSNATVGKLVIFSTGAVTVNGPASLTFAANGTPAQLIANRGEHSIAAPVRLMSNLDLNIGTASGIYVGTLNGASYAIAKQGAGVLSSREVSAATLNVAQGVLKFMPNSGVSVVQTLVVDETVAELDLRSTAMIVDYTGSSPLGSLADQDTIAGWIHTGRMNNWTGKGIRTSLGGSGSDWAIGFAEAGSLFSSPSTFLGESIDETTVLIRATIYGDATLDGVVNIADSGRLNARFNQPGLWWDGDFNYDGIINISDYSLIAANFNKTIPNDSGRGGVFVPEPSSAFMLALGVWLLYQRCPRRIRESVAC